MSSNKKVPRRLYKYREFSSRTLDFLIRDFLWYADPSTFNDPMDSKPSIEIDLDEENLEWVLKRLVERRTRATMQAAAKVVKYRGPKTIDHIERHSRKQADDVVKEIEYFAAEWDDNPKEKSALSWAITLGRNYFNNTTGALCRSQSVPPVH